MEAERKTEMLFQSLLSQSFEGIDVMEVDYDRFFEGINQLVDKFNQSLNYMSKSLIRLRKYLAEN